MKIVRTTECRTSPWKKGGGSTTEIAISPPSASLDAFDWRISTARVASDGPFSEFPGVDRTLAVLEGDGLSLTIGDSAPIVLDRNAEPVNFPGDTRAAARLHAGEIRDLNVMTLRGAFEHRLVHIRQPTVCDFMRYDVAVVVASFGDVNLQSFGAKATLARGDAAILARESDGNCKVTPAAETGCYLALLRICRGQIGWA
ncbi:HutD/Ves family protein [Bradyrhizobium sp. CCBAU 11361]|uniref:HutD/Ves family protein n=1 Tax=Bradyrhizobium sp. CCBAU 11361 TaxID=1630812 RepID=UPI0023057F26|nr:HutD family protein [Bradyrhizobium sp. CCBAU 11361]